MSHTLRWAVEIVALVALVVAAVAAYHLAAAPFWLTAVALLGSLAATHIVLHYAEEAAR